MTSPGHTRRDVLKRAYIAPAILTLAAAPEFAKAGSFKPPGPPDGKPPGPPPGRP